MKLKKYKDKTYGVNYAFVYDIVDIKKLAPFLKRKDKKIYKWYVAVDTPKEEKDFAGRTIHNSNNILILFKKETDYPFFVSVVVHELLHAMFFVFGERGIEIQSGGNNEHCTYYLDHLVMEVLSK